MVISMRRLGNALISIWKKVKLLRFYYQKFKEIIFSIVFVTLYIAAAVGIGIGIPLASSLLANQNQLVIAPFILLTGFISSVIVAVLVLLVGPIKSSISASEIRFPKIPDYMQRLRWLNLHYYFSRIFIFIVLIIFLVSFMILIFLEWNSFSSFRIILVGVWFGFAYILFIPSFDSFRREILDMNTSVGASAFATLALELLSRNDREGLKYLHTSLIMTRRTLLEDEYAPKDIDELRVAIEIFRYHVKEIPFKEFSKLASSIIELPFFKQLSNSVKEILSSDNITWTKMYETKITWRVYLKSIALFIPVLAIFVSFLPDESKQSMLSFLTAVSQQSIEVLLILAIYFQIWCAFMVVDPLFSNSISQKHRRFLKKLWIKDKDILDAKKLEGVGESKPLDKIHEKELKEILMSQESISKALRCHNLFNIERITEGLIFETESVITDIGSSLAKMSALVKKYLYELKIISDRDQTIAINEIISKLDKHSKDLRSCGNERTSEIMDSFKIPFELILPCFEFVEQLREIGLRSVQLGYQLALERSQSAYQNLSTSFAKKKITFAIVRILIIVVAFAGFLATILFEMFTSPMFDSITNIQYHFILMSTLAFAIHIIITKFSESIKKRIYSNITQRLLVNMIYLKVLHAEIKAQIRKSNSAQ